MINGKSKFLGVCIMIFSSVYGCHFSFHSNQYGMFKGMIESFSGDINEASSIPEWVLDWSGYELKMLPTTVADETWFVGAGDVVIRFDGWQIHRVDNLLPRGITITNKISEYELTVWENEKFISRYECSNWISDGNALETNRLLRQTCFAQDQEFENMIKVGDQGEITELSFIVHPNYPAVLLKRVSLL